MEKVYNKTKPAKGLCILLKCQIIDMERGNCFLLRNYME